jgi:hypothetical protein
MNTASPRAPPSGGISRLKSAPAATQMRKNGTATIIDRKADINLKIWFREGGLGGFPETEWPWLPIKSKEETHVEIRTISRLARRGRLAER